MNKMLLACFLSACGLVVGAQAQSSAWIGAVTNVVSGNCTDSRWISGTGVVCNHAMVNCASVSGVASLGITYAYEGPSSPRGTIVFFSDGEGTTPTGGENPVGCNEVTCHDIKGYANDYSNNYLVVQTAWDTTYNGNPADGWEDPTNGSGGSIGDAACRPATFLAYVRFGSGTNPALWTTGGMCVQGESAGGAAAIYPLAWYGAGSGTGQYQNYIDKVSLLSSPPLADIKKGCEVVGGLAAQYATVCPTGQLGCNPSNTPSSWTQDLNYTDPALTAVREWTGLNSCSDSTVTLPSYNAAWKAMSIVDGNIGTFNYPNTNITGWLCSSVGGVGDNDGPMNNSSPEAQLFFAQFTSSSQYQGLTINGVSGCENAEEVSAGTPPSNYHETIGWKAIEDDMNDATNGCFSHHGQ